MEYTIGIDIGGTNTKLGVVSGEGKVVKRGEFKTGNYNDFTSYITALEKAIRALIDAMDDGNSKCLGIGIGAPNGNYYSGCIEYAPNLSFGKFAPIVETLKKDLGYEDVYLSNDANAAAVGEKIYGGARNIKDFIVITLGTGVGSGIFVDDKLLLGADGFAGELGHTCAVPNGRPCGCGRLGCLEAYASATGIRRTFFELLAKYNGKSIIANKKWDEVDAKVIEDAAKAGDRVAMETYEFTGNILGKSLADFVCFSRPEVIFLFGGPVKSGEMILQPTRDSMERYMLPLFRGKVRVEASKLKESDAAILGAAAMVSQSKTK